MTFTLGIIGSVILVVGAALRDAPMRHPSQSLKNWFFAIGAVFMATFSTLNWMAGGPVFFIFLQALVILSSVFMMLDVDDRIDSSVTVIAALGLITWSLYLAQGYETILFILGLVGIALGYELKGGTVKREVALILGSIMLALFSYLTSTWIFFWLNAFFAGFSAWQAWKVVKESQIDAHLIPPHAVG